VSEDSIKTELSEEASKEAKKPSYTGLDDIFRRGGADKTASIPFEPKEVMTFSSNTFHLKTNLYSLTRLYRWLFADAGPRSALSVH